MPVPLPPPSGVGSAPARRGGEVVRDGVCAVITDFIPALLAAVPVVAAGNDTRCTYLRVWTRGTVPWKLADHEESLQGTGRVEAWKNT